MLLVAWCWARDRLRALSFGSLTTCVRMRCWSGMNPSAGLADFSRPEEDMSIWRQKRASILLFPDDTVGDSAPKVEGA